MYFKSEEVVIIFQDDIKFYFLLDWLFGLYKLLGLFYEFFMGYVCYVFLVILDFIQQLLLVRLLFFYNLLNFFRWQYEIVFLCSIWVEFYCLRVICIVGFMVVIFRVICGEIQDFVFWFGFVFSVVVVFDFFGEIFGNFDYVWQVWWQYFRIVGEVLWSEDEVIVVVEVDIRMNVFFGGIEFFGEG